ncbi:MAG: hypothetical protein ACT4OS_00245 [Acidimicrobiales bacterium]
MATTLKVGNTVLIPWGTGEVRGTLTELYGTGKARHGVVTLHPDESGFVVDEPTTFSFPVDMIRPAGVAA